MSIEYIYILYNSRVYVGYSFSQKENIDICLIQNCEDHDEIYFFYTIILYFGLPRWCSGKESTCHCRRCKRHGFQSRGQKDPLEEEVATQSSILTLKVLWTEEPGKLQRPWGHKELDTTEHAHSVFT